MTPSSPIAVLVPGLRGRVLTALVRRAEPLSIRQVARIVGSSSPAGVQRALLALVDDGLVRAVVTAPGGHFFMLRPGGPMTRALHALDAVRDEVPDAIGEHVSAWRPPPRSVVLFGPYAHGQDADQVDVLIVWGASRVEPWVTTQLILSHVITEAAGIPPAIETWPGEEWDNAVRARDPFVRRIATEGVRLQGEAIPLLTRGLRYL